MASELLWYVISKVKKKLFMKYYFDYARSVLLLDGSLVT